MARRQLAKVTNEGLIEYALQVITKTMMTMMIMMKMMTVIAKFPLSDRYCNDGVDSECGQDFRLKVQSRLQRFQSECLLHSILVARLKSKPGCLAQLNLSCGKTEKRLKLKFSRFLRRTVVGAAQVGRAQRAQGGGRRKLKPQSGAPMWTGCSQVGKLIKDKRVSFWI